MKKFTFALDKVLSYKEQYENSLRNEHAAIMLQVTRQEEKLSELEVQDADTRREFEQEKRKGCQIARMRAYEGYLDHMAEKIRSEQQQLEVLRLREEEKRKELIAAKQDTASIDKLKEKKKIEYDKLVQKEQEQMVEEFVNHEMQLAQ